MRTAMPDVLLMTALFSPRDEDELFAHLKTLDNAGHLQTHTIPQLASAPGQGEGRSGRGFLSAFRRKKDPDPAVAGCDPDLFAEEIRVFLQHAADKKREIAESPTAAHAFRGGPSEKKPAAPQGDTEIPGESAGSASSWESPFEWKPTTARTQAPGAEAPPPARPRASVAPLDQPNAADALFAIPLERAEPQAP